VRVFPEKTNVPILVTCECGKQFQTRDENVGRRAQCPECGRELIIPKGDVNPFDAPTLLEGVEARTSGKAIASLVLGLLSLVCTLFTGIPAIILGALGLSDIGRSGGRIGGKGMATAGIILGGIGAILVPIALLLPAVQAAREAARRAQCTNNLKQIGLAMHNYLSANNCFPPAAITDADGKPLLSWRVAILPFIEQQSLYQEFHLDEPWDSPHNQALIARIPPVYLCPSDGPDSEHTTRYQVVVGPGTIFEGARGIRLDEVTDGTSNTLLVVEAKNPVPWTKPDDIPVNALTAAVGSKHPGGFNVLMADGSVRFVRMSINPAILQALATRNGGEVISAASF
jgi:prepilin-type processing-associated H-X9-DG protein